MDHRAVRTKPLLTCFRHLADDGLHLFQHLLVAQHQCRLVHQPRALDVMTIALQLSGTTCPVHFEEEVEVMGLKIQYAVGEDVNKVAKSPLHADDYLLWHADVYGKNRSDGGHIVARWKPVTLPNNDRGWYKAQ